MYTPTRYHSIDISRDCAQEIESPYNRSKDALMNDDNDHHILMNHSSTQHFSLS